MINKRKQGGRYNDGGIRITELACFFVMDDIFYT